MKSCKTGLLKQVNGNRVVNNRGCVILLLCAYACVHCTCIIVWQLCPVDTNNSPHTWVLLRSLSSPPLIPSHFVLSCHSDLSYCSVMGAMAPFSLTHSVLASLTAAIFALMLLKCQECKHSGASQNHIKDCIFVSEASVAWIDPR